MATTTAERDFSTLSHMVLWFGASISIAEIITGTLLAPLGFQVGFLATLLGHLIGASVLFLAGLIGATSGLSATASFRISFGKFGSYIFSILNIMQLTGWTAVMILSGSKALDGIASVIAGYQNEKLWCLLIGGLILIWISRGLKAIFRIHTFVVIALLGCFTVLAYNLFTAPTPDSGVNVGAFAPINFGEAVEFSAAMCLSWLPLISDYSRTLRKPIGGTFWGVFCYFFGGTIMFTLGLAAALFTGTSEISDMLLTAGLGVVGLFIVAFSTVTNTFLDAHSAGVSAGNISNRINERLMGICVCVLATIVAMFVPMSQYENFLYLIGSVFAPLFAILLVDFFVFKRRDINYAISIKSLILWLIGFIIYRAFMSHSIVLGMTFPVMVIIGTLCFVVNTVLEMKGRH